MKTLKVNVFGSGIFGLWTALQLQSRSAQVRLYDRFGVANEHGMSVAPYRLTRTLYGKRHLYIRLVAESLEDWNRLQEDTGVNLYEEVGVWWMFPDKSPQFVRDARPACKQYDLPVSSVPLEVARRRFPYVNFEGISSIYHDKRAGFLRARKCCTALLNRFEKLGGEYRPGHVTRVGKTTGGIVQEVEFSDGSSVKGDHFVFACGPWLSELFGNLFKIRLTRQLEYYFKPPEVLKRNRKTPVMIDFGQGDALFYGLYDKAEPYFKIGDDRPHGRIGTTTGEEATAEEIANGRRLLEMRFPGLSDAELVKARVCRYDRTPNEDLLADRHPDFSNVWILGGGSGHGFKNSPALGRYISRRVLGDTMELIPEFSISNAQKRFGTVGARTAAAAAFQQGLPRHLGGRVVGGRT